jgi:CheY-like chemotaxis protein
MGAARCDYRPVRPTVVIVDDHPAFRRRVRRLLVEGGFRVVAEAADGMSALASVVRLAPDVVLLDVVLPDLSGVEVAERLAARVPSTRIVLVSSRSARDLGILEGAGRPRFVRKDELVLDRLDELLGCEG